MCNAGSRGGGIADVRHPHGRTEYGRLRRRCAGAQAAPRGGAGLQPTKGIRGRTFMCASEGGRGGKGGRYVRSWSGLPWRIWWVMMMVILCEEVEGEGELIGMSGLGDCWLGGRRAQAKGERAMAAHGSRNGPAAAAASVGMDTKNSIFVARWCAPRPCRGGSASWWPFFGQVEERSCQKKSHKVM